MSVPSTSRGRRLRRAAVAAVALAALAAALNSIRGSIRWEDLALALSPAPRAVARAADAAGPAAQGVPDPGDPSERCELRVFRDGPGGEAVVLLSDPGKMTEFRSGYLGNHSRLAREVARQAVLIAAREGLHLAVRDAAIGDPEPRGRPAEVLEVDALCPPEALTLRLCRGGEAGRVALLERTLRDNPKLNDHRTLVENAEAASRSGLPEALAKAGIPGKPAPGAGDGGLPEGVESRLERMASVPQLEALRQVHAAIRADGESPLRLSALARGYAHLGLLTSYQWDAASRAYQARSLLYAQRLLAADPKSPSGLWHRAYAATLAGLHQMALHDLREARQLVEALPEADRPRPPDWVPLLQASCRYAADRLAEARGGPHPELAALLHLLAVEYPPDTDIALRAARAAIEANPQCFRAHDALCAVGGVANLHMATTIAPEVLSRVVPGAIAAIGGLPEAARKAAEGEPDEVALTKALDEAAEAARDPVEPSWGALARIVRETRFAFTFRRLDFMRERWSVPTDDYWDEVKALVAGHRFRPFLESYVDGLDHTGLREFAEGLDTTDFGINVAPMYYRLRRVLDPDPRLAIFGIASLCSDWTARDLSLRLVHYRKAEPVDSAHKLLMVSPNAPYAMGVLIQHAWDEAEPKLDAWRKVVGDHPSLLAGLVRHYDKFGTDEQAEGTFRRYIDQSPDFWAFQALAKRFKDRGDLVRWKATLDEFLAKVEDHGLDHAKVRVEIAETLMKSGRYDEARPYADAAAQTWAGWAMRTAEECAEGQQDWEAAEGWARARAERYPSTSAYDWLAFCLRTGRGDLGAARDSTLEMLAGFGGQVSAEVTVPRACLQMMAGRPAEGIADLRLLADAPGDDPAPHQTALVTLLAAAAQADDAAVVDATARQFLDRYAAQAPKFSAILAELRKAVAKRGPDALDRKAVDAVIADTPEPSRGGPALVVASYLAGAGKHDEAKPYWRLAARTAEAPFWWRLVAEGTFRQRYRESATGGPEPKP